MKPNLDCNYRFPTDLAPNRILFGARSVGKVYLQSKFGLILPSSENISLCMILLTISYRLQIDVSKKGKKIVTGFRFLLFRKMIPSVVSRVWLHEGY